MTLVGSLEVSVDADAVTFAFTVRNGGSAPQPLEFRSGKTADVVLRRDGEQVWQWSEGRMFSQALGHEELAPGESTTYHLDWNDPERGEFEATASLAAENVEVDAATSFVVR